MSRRLGSAAPTVDISDDVELTRMNDTTYTFTMKVNNVKVDVVYKHRHVWDFSTEGDSLFANCENQSGDCKIEKVKAGIALDGLIYGSAKGAVLDLKLFNDNLEGEAVAEVTSTSYSGIIKQTGKIYGPSASVPTLPGTYTVTIKVKATDADEHESELTLTKDYTVGQKALEENMVQSIPNVTYNGMKQEPDVKLIFQGKTLVQNVDYTVEYRDNVNAGVGLVIFTGIGQLHRHHHHGLQHPGQAADARHGS